MNISCFRTPKETAKKLRCSTRSLERKRLDGTGPRFVKVGRKVIYEDSEIDLYVKARTFTSTSEIGEA